MISLNLLPSEIREEIAISKENARLRQFVYYAISVALGMLVLYLLVFFFLYTQKIEGAKQKELAQKQISEQEKTFTKAKDLYSRISIIKKIKGSALNWNLIFEEVGKLTPQNVQVNTFTTDVNGADIRIKIVGAAATDKDVVAFKDNLTNSEYFKYVDVESIQEGKDARERVIRVFALSFSLNLDKVKK